MKQTVLGLAVLTAVGLSACSSTKVANVGTGSAIPAGTQQAISEQRLSNDFKRLGVRITYTLGGEVDSIETTGYAPVWGNSQNAAREAFRVAELEAKKSLNDFINRESIASTTSVAMISKNLEQAKDNKTNKFATNKSRDVVVEETSDEDVKETLLTLNAANANFARANLVAAKSFSKAFQTAAEQAQKNLKSAVNSK